MTPDETVKFPKPDLKRPDALVSLDTQEKFPLGTERITIGRAEDNMICLEHDIYVSGHHALIYFERQDCLIRDLGSQNGTLVNNLSISAPVKIKPGDIITIGRTRFQLE